MLYNKEEHFIVEKLVEQNRRMRKFGKFFFIDTNKVYATLSGLRNAIATKRYASIQEFYDKYYKSDTEGLCKYCGKETKFVNVIEGYKESCGHCDGWRIEHNKKLAASANKKDVIEKKVKHRKDFFNSLTEEELKEKYRVQFEKHESTSINRYGENWRSDKAKIQWQNKSEEERKAIAEKGKKTKEENISHGIYPKPGWNRRVTLEGITYSCQGYEDIVLTELSDMNIKFVLGNNVPRIDCSFNKCKKARPDIYLPEYNVIIEVKSEYTLSTNLPKLAEIAKNSFERNIPYIIFSLRIDARRKRVMPDYDKNSLYDIMNKTISSQGQYLFNIDKVQRLSCDGEYRPIVFGSGNGRVPEDKIWYVI